MEAEYERLLKLYQRAVLCGRKYAWDKPRCVRELTAIEGTVVDVVDEAERASMVLDEVIRIIKADKIEQHNTHLKLRKLSEAMAVLQCAEERLAVARAVGGWSSAVCGLVAVTSKVYTEDELLVRHLLEELTEIDPSIYQPNFDVTVESESGSMTYM